MSSKKLSIIIPVYNEENTVFEILEKVRGVNLDDMLKELIIVNDGSSDTSENRILDFHKKYPYTIIKYIKHENNRGKGAAIKSGLTYATGDYVVIQDADLEYDPSDYTLLLNCVLTRKANVVYGSRFLDGSPVHKMAYRNKIANKILTSFSNSLNELKISDLETGFKLFRTDILRSINLEEQRFGFEPEVTAKIFKLKGLKFEEVGISYNSRSYKEGKKIKWHDGFKALYCILKYNLSKNLN